MDSYLDELYTHQEWADSEHWRAFEAHGSALADKALRERLLHIHLVQHGFLWIAGPRSSQFEFKKLEDFTTNAEFKTYAQQGNAALRELLQSGTADWLKETIEIPWFQPSLTISRATH